MIKKSIIAVVVMLAAAALVFGASGNHTNSTSNSDQGQSSVTDNNNSTSDTGSTSSTSGNNTTKTKISSAEAKKIAQKYIEVSSATAGTPKLIKTNGQYIYAVPVINNGTNVGEIDIDALTGKNVGGAGGAP